MDAQVLTSLDTLINDFTSGGVQSLEQVILLASPLFITVSVVFFGIRIFRSIARI